MGKTKCIRKTEERKSVLWRSSDYRQRCSDGFKSGAWEAHHILCNHAVEGRDIDPTVKHYVEDCLWVTDWDLNDSDNMVGLPLNRQYRQSLGQDPVDVCSHQVDHNTSNGYTWECSEWLKDNVWDTIKDKQKEHSVEAQRIQALLKKGTKIFKRRLKNRGEREGGTRLCWKHRFKSDRDHIERWYFPFSMGETPRERSPGVAANDLTSIFRILR